MQVDKQPFAVNIGELAGKKVLVWPDVVDKYKGRILSLVVPARQIYRKGWLLRRLRTKRRLIRPEAPGGTRNWLADQSLISHALRTT
jgi:hypothetical protein